MPDVYIGDGALAGKGVYARRSFAAGELVVRYRLRKLSREEYRNLPETERLFVHSYWGERHLYPAPARYVNHSDAPNTYQDFEGQCDVALEPIAAGELVTTDATKETERELTTFLIAFETAVDGGDRPALESLVDDRAVVWLPGQPAGDKARLLENLGRQSVDGRHGPSLSIRDVSWIVGTGRWEAVCSYDFEPRERVRPGDDRSTGHVTDVLKLIEGNWQLIYRHVSSPSMWSSMS